MPADYSTENGKVRYNVGDITEPYITGDDVIDALLTSYHEDTEEVRIWKTTVAILKTMKAQFAIEADRAREREGGVEVERYYTKRYERLCELLDDFEENPPIDVAGAAFAGIFFGGVSRTEKARVENNPDSVLPGAKIIPFEDKTEYASYWDEYWKRY